MKVTIFSNLDELLNEYPAICDVTAGADVFRSFPWFQNLAATSLEKNHQLRIYAVRSNKSKDLLPSMLPMQHAQNDVSIAPYTLFALANYYSPVFGPIIDTQCEDVPQIVFALVNAICSDEPGWDVVDFHPLDSDGLISEQLKSAFTKLHWSMQPYFCFGNWYLKVNHRSYNEYFRGLPSVIRKNVPYMKRKLDKVARLKMEIITNNERLDWAIGAYEMIYNNSWRTAEGYPKFIRGLIYTAAEHGWLRLGLLHVDDEPAAAQLWLVNGPVASIYKVCYAEKFSKWAVGNALTAHLLEHVIDIDKVQEVDFLSGDDFYKANWMSDRRERWGIRAFNPNTIKGRLAGVRHIGAQALKKTTQRVWQTPGGIAAYVKPFLGLLFGRDGDRTPH